MRLAGDFLSKFKSLTPPDEAVKAALIKVVRSVAGVSLTKKDIALVRGTAFVDCSSVAKSAIRVARGKILEELFFEMPKARETMRDIR